MSWDDGDYQAAQEALEQHIQVTKLSKSENLLCECNPVSYREVFSFIEATSTPHLNPAYIMNALRIAQGCGTCLNNAQSLIYMVLETNNLNEKKECVDDDLLT